jgi:hypothetical protein
MWPWQRTVEADERIHFEVPGVGRTEARVIRAVPGAAELLLGAGGVARLPVTPRFLHGRSCLLTPTGEGTTERIVGRVVTVQTWDGRVHDELIQVVFTLFRSADVPAAAGDGPASAGAHRAQRRAFHRAPVIAPVTLVPERFRVGWLEGRTRDLSASGALVSGAERLREGERLRVLLELGPDDLLDASGRIVRFDVTGLAGLRLDRLATKDRERLVRYVALRQRESLAALRDR